MRYLVASGAVLAAATTFSLTPLDPTALASEAKPAVGSLIGSNTIVPLSGTLTYNIKRYKKPKLLQAWVEYFRPPRCEEISKGEWKPPEAAINKMTQNCGKDKKGNVLKCGNVTFDTVDGKLANGDCPGTTFTFAGIFYMWTAHNNQSTAPAPPNKVADTFNAKWNSPDQVFKEDFTFKINVPVVRPDHETTACEDWVPDATSCWWRMTLIPPSSDPTFDFTGEFAHELAAAPKGPDNCWYKGSGFTKLDMVTDPPDPRVFHWVVEGAPNKNTIYHDSVGYNAPAVTTYRLGSPYFKAHGSCGTMFGQTMTIHAPSDADVSAAGYTPYGATDTGNINLLGGSMTATHVKSIRAGMPAKIKWPP